MEEKISLHWMNRSEYKRFFCLKFWVGCVKTMTVKCSSGGCQITENKIESHQGEHTIYLSHSKRGILFLPTMEARHSWRLLVHKHGIRGNQPARCEANYRADIHFLLKTYSKSEIFISYCWPQTFKMDEPKHTIC